MGKIRKEDLIVSANETLSNFSYEELMDIRSGMLKSFYTNHARILRILYKVTLNFGFFTMLRLIRSMFNNSLGRTPEEFHGGKILRKQITISSEHKVSDQL